MLSLLFSDPYLFVVAFAGLLLAITIHEFAHAFAADKLGDPTPRVQGRLSLNPLVHLDPLGSVMLLLAGFGWGKPVQFDPYNLENPRRDAAIISFAGPLSNILMATVLSILLRILFETGAHLELVGPALYQIIYMNVLLAVFNLIPIHPLDGGKILIGLLPKNLAYEWDKILQQYGLYLLLFLIVPFFGTPLVSKFISPVIQIILKILLPSI